MGNLHSSFKTVDDPPHPAHEADTTMRFSLWWKHPGEKALVKETYEKITGDPEQWSRDIIDWFNSTLRPHERKRIFVRCEVEGEVPPAEHKWAKVTAMTKANQYGMPYDAMQCERCGITGKRFGLGPHTKIDSKFRRAAFKRCDTSLKAQGKQALSGRQQGD
jgi:hypothetical protein